MGLCVSSGDDPDAKRLKAVDRRMASGIQEDTSKESKVIKLLLLGTGESGKSTVFKQMQILHGKVAFSEHERATYKDVVRRNVVESIQALIVGAARFGYKLDSEEAEKAARFLHDVDWLNSEFWVPEIPQHIKTLWHNEDPAIKRSFDNRSRLQLPDSAVYFFDNLDRISQAAYTPSNADILRARLRTSGIVERDFLIEEVNFKFIDVGGQRNERRKWIHCFDDVMAVIFVAAISEYDQTLYEDEKGNRLQESIQVFGNICDKHFADTAMILFLNKTDIFMEKIKTKSLRDECFKDYTGPSGDWKAAAAFIQAKFNDAAVQNNPQREVFAHFTTATDTNNIERVFNNCKRLILKNNLKVLGISD